VYYGTMEDTITEVENPKQVLLGTTGLRWSNWRPSLI